MINRIAVIGSGFMGQQIAAHFLNSYFPVTLVSVTQKKNKEDLSQITNPKNSLLDDSNYLNSLNIVDFDTFMESASEYDLIIESVVENFEVKFNLYKNLEKVIHEQAIIATNTSGLSINKLSNHLKNDVKNRFLGMHFFAPIAYSHLIELIPSDSLRNELLKEVQELVISKLGKNYIVANDVEGFIANRIGFYTNHEIMERGERLGLKIPYIDSLSGKVIGRSKMGPYRLTDLTGIQLSEVSFENYQSNDFLKSFFKKRKAQLPLLENGWTGDQAGQGYYKKDNDRKLVYDFGSNDYKPFSFPSHSIIKEIEGKPLAEKLEIIFLDGSDASKFMKDSLAHFIHFAAWNVGVATDHYKDIDRAMVWGYNHKVGPFQIWQIVGFKRIKDYIEKTIGELPNWINKFDGNFYNTNESLSIVSDAVSIKKEILTELPNEFVVYTTKDDFLIFEIQSYNGILNSQINRKLLSVVKELQTSKYKGLLITSKSDNFSLGFDAKMMEDSIDSGEFKNKIKQSSKEGHQLVDTIKYSKKPIVSGVRGLALGGGAEIVMHSPLVVAAKNTRIGLTETQLGLIPSGGGLSEIAERVNTQSISRFEKKRQLQKMFNTIISAKISKNALHAIKLGFLKDSALIVPHPDLVVPTALQFLRANEFSFKPNYPKTFDTLGTDFIGIAQASIMNGVSSGFYSHHDAFIASAVAEVLAGGNVPLGFLVDKKSIEKLEAEKFIELGMTDKTKERIHSLMKNGKVLHN